MTKNLFRAALIAGIATAIVGCDNSSDSTSPTAAVNTNTSATTAKTHPDLQKLQGKWERPDGGYVLEIRGVDAEGKVDAGYFNPSPINVSVGRAYREAGATKLFVELRDVNYPGCTYKLELDPKTDQLSGQYFQASMNETFDVTFVRLQ